MAYRMQYMMFAYETAKFALVWVTVLKIRAVFVHQSLNEHALYFVASRNFHVALESRLYHE